MFEPFPNLYPGIEEARNAGWIFLPTPVGQATACSQARNGWDPFGTIASGVGAPGDKIRLADLNGDGRDDFLVLNDNGSVEMWIDQGGDPARTG